MIKVHRFNIYTTDKGWAYDFVIQPQHIPDLIAQEEAETIEKAIHTTLVEMGIPCEAVTFDEEFDADSMDDDMSQDVMALVYFPAGEGPGPDAEFVDPRTLL